MLLLCPPTARRKRPRDLVLRAQFGDQLLVLPDFDILTVDALTSLLDGFLVGFALDYLGRRRRVSVRLQNIHTV
jgi:hypothetical protein